MSWTSTVNSQLGLVCALCSVLLLGILLQRILNVLCGILLSGLMFLPDSQNVDGALKKYAQQGLVGSAIRFAVMVVVSVVQLLMVALNVAFTIIYGLLPLVAIALLLVLVHERWSDTMLVLVDVVNGQVGDTLHELIIAPLTIIDEVGKYVLPIYNLVVYILIRIPLQFLVWLLKGNGFVHLLKALGEIKNAAFALAMATKVFVVENNPSTCYNNNNKAMNASMICNNVTDECISVVTQQMSTMCLQLVKKELDFMPAFDSLRASASFLNLFVADSCLFIALFANVTLYPLTDRELWHGLDRLLNTALYTVVSATSMAITRCDMAGGIEQRPAMCTPDFGPAFDKFASFGVHIGNALTNWMDAAYLFMFRQMNMQTACEASSKLSELLWKDATVQRLFGTNHTVLIRMNDDAIAVSDGNSVVFVKSLAGQIRKTYAPNLWPTTVQPTFGIARVLLPSGVNVQDNGLGLLGCRCSNTSEGNANVTCSIITQDGAAWEMPVQWSLATEVQLLTCDRLRLVVQSVRWPHKRVLVNAVNQNGEPIAKSEEDLSPGDAVVYAVPVCGAESGVKALACLANPIFTRGICFPYCMALRLRFEGFQTLMMRGASEWEEGVLMSRRSCIPSANATDGTLMQTVCSLTSSRSGSTEVQLGGNPSDSCVYAYSCSTMVLNRTAVTGYDKASQFPASTSADNGFHLVLMGQPLVMGGDVHMRMFTQGAEQKKYVEFPTLVGNQIGEFTMEANTPIGIPVTPPADVPKLSVQAERPGELYEPVNYVDARIPYHPATLTRTALWYASNPSYDWIKAMAIYCGSEGHDARTQISLLSSYTPIRIRRILYHDYENCYIARETGKHVCRPDVALATAMERQIDIMSSTALDGSTTLYDMCTSQYEFNLWVESMEYYNEDNVAVAVRRGTLGELGRHLVADSAAPHGKTVFYFFNASNISQPAREGDYHVLAQSNHFTCPALKVMPDVGAVVGHAVASVAHLFRVPVNLVLNPFAMMELLSSRAKRTCPENSLQHSVLSECGMKLLSLDEFFVELYTANDALWNLGFWLVSTILPPNVVEESKEASLFRSFLQGAVVVGDATKVISMFDVVHSVELMDTGIEDSLLRRRTRRLLGTKLTLLSNMLSGLKSGFSSLLSLGQSVMGLATMSMSAGMNFGMLLASQDPTVQFTGAAVSAPTIAWAHFTYQASLPIVLDVLGLVKESGTASMAPVWSHLQDAESKFQSIVQSRSERACLGLRIMLGYSGSLGKALHYNCLAGQAMVNGMMRLLLTVLVDVQLYRCLCVNPIGNADFEAYVHTHCLPMVPPSRRDKWQNTMYAITARSSQAMQSVCQLYASEIETQVYGAFDAWKYNAVLSAESLASVLDEFFVPEAHAGSCQNTVSNPTAMVLTPTPLAHYQVCARTSDCQAKCADANSLFEYERQRLQNLGVSVHADKQMVDVTLESPLFNRYATSNMQYYQWAIVAVRMLPNQNSSVYGCVQRCQGRCIAVAQMRNDAKMIKVDYYCLPPPEMILATVYNTNLDGFEFSIEQLVGDGGEIRGVDFALDLKKTYLVLYVFRSMTADTVKGQTRMMQSHEVHVYDRDAEHLIRILRTEDLANGALGKANVVHGLFGGSIEKPSVSNCRISSITEIASAGTLVFFIEFTMDIRALQLNTEAWVENNYVLRAILRWNDNTPHLRFYPPCSAACTSEDCGGTCHPGLEGVLRLMHTGTLVHIQSNEYLFVPVLYDVTANNGLERLQIDATGGLLLSSQKRSVRLSNTADNMQVLGRWTRASMFSTIAVPRQVRDVSAHDTQRTYPHFFQSTTDMSAQWLQEIRLAGVKLKVYYSQQTTQTAIAQTTCTVLSCSGCATSNLRLLCHQAQNCALSRCLGTIVQTKNALCGIGQLVQHTFLQAVSTWHAMFMMGAELALLVGKGLSEQSLHVIVLKFPTEQFYNLLCACKDMLASVVGMGMSVGTVLSNLLVGKGLDLTGGQDVGALVGEQSLKTLSIGQFFFNTITGMTLLPLMAVHRWIMCMANASLVATSEVGVSVRFGDVMMDTTWMQCAHISSVFDVLNNDNISAEVESVILMFVNFVLTLVTGIGETLLFGLELCWDSTVDFLVGIVFGVQQMLYAYNLRACKVPNYAMRYVLWCSCQDEAYSIPAAQRSHGIAHGALWCVGSLSMTLLDGSIGTVYNPYTMQELSEGVRGVTEYIYCLSEHSDAGACTAPGSTRLQTLVDQGVEPIAVWARCKNNYMQNTWDIGAGSLFMPTYEEGMQGGMVEALHSMAMAWGMGLGADFMQCMQDTSRLLVDYSSCMRMFMSSSLNATPSAYFLYEKATTTSEPPDACLVFSGLNASAEGALQTLMSDCMMQEGVGQVTACDLNPLIWSGEQAHKAPAANLHGTVPPLQNKGSNNTTTKAGAWQNSSELYEPILRTFLKAVSTLQGVYDQQSALIDAILFSADGDFIHDFFDCMYLGPYTRVDMLASCDPSDNTLDCLFYARDDMGGMSRNFTACYGDEAMHGDHELPFTCGSQARRSLIKYFFRNYSRSNHAHLSLNVSHKIKQAVQALIENYTDPRSWGCWDPLLRECRIEACSMEANAYKPCLATAFEVSSEEVSDFIVNGLLGSLNEYYALSMHDATPWTAFYTDAKVRALPIQWGQNAEMATVAQSLGWYTPHAPLITYGPEQVYTMPTHTETSREKRIRESPLWGMCTSLLAQTAMSLPLLFDKTEQAWFPAGFWQGLVQDDKLEEIEWVVSNITRHMLAMEHCPFVWHQSKRHAPSESMVCAQTKQDWAMDAKRLRVQSVSIESQLKTPIQAAVAEGLSFPFLGFLHGYLGHTDQTCICAVSDSQVHGKCVVSSETCDSFAKAWEYWEDAKCTVLREACLSPDKKYDRSNVQHLTECLMMMTSSKNGSVRCPELGPSDWWGLFPVDCSEDECELAQQWVSMGANDIPYSATRFLNEGKAGMRLPNFRHINDTFHQAIHYGTANSKQPSSIKQPQCFAHGPSLYPTTDDENVADDSVFRTLFPAAQALFDAPSTATCTRYVIEIMRAEAMGLVSDSAGATARIQAMRWKRRCAAKIRQLGACHMHGVFYDTPAPALWGELAAAECGGITLAPSLQHAGAYLTPGCVLVNPATRRMYDARLCATRSASSIIVVPSDACLLVPQPLDWFKGNIPLSMVYAPGGHTLAKSDALSELSDSVSMEYLVWNSRYEKAERESVSHVLDWWPDENKVSMPPGYHPTAATDPEELAPALWDTHYAYDPSTRKAFYVHSALRNGSLVYNTVGAAGLCRGHKVRMPLFDANTNRICTRSSKKRDATPTVPVAIPPNPGGTEELGPTYSNEYMATYFEAEERCAVHHDDVPWTADADDFQSRSAGGILGWQHYVTMDTNDISTYDKEQQSFPPRWYELSKLRQFDDKWGPCRMSWGDRVECNSHTDCMSPPTACLAPPNQTSKVCFSIEGSQRFQQPCFRTEHCPDGMVCLVDGTCSPLRIHVWNDDLESMEVAVLADKCPQAGTMRGASPWEIVPDTLHVHGMCSHHNWFSYRHALRAGICTRPTAEYLSCNASQEEWPWVQQRFDGKSTAGTTETQTMGAGNMLLAHAHPCDARFMHLQAPSTGQRMQVCFPETSFWSYDLQQDTSSWTGATMTETLSTTDKQGWWLRTYDESTNQLHIGIVGATANTNVPLGFLGADQNAAGVVGEMSDAEKVRFVRCADKLKCNNPPYTFNGIEITYRLVGDKHENLTEASLRRCGAIGYLNGDLCTLDVMLFPLFAHIVWGESCSALWPRYVIQNSAWLIRGDEDTNAALLHIRGNPNTLFCTSSACYYAARSAVLTQQNTADNIATITAKLNLLLQQAGAVVLSSQATVTETYEAINQCMGAVMHTLLSMQVGRQAAYGATGPSGVYYAYSLTLYEIPLAWLHHAMLVTLLSTIDSSISPPALSQIGYQNKIAVALWGMDRSTSFCTNTELLSNKPALWSIICQNKHAAYTFQSSARTWRASMVEAIENRARAAVQNTMVTNNELVNIYCHDKLSWKCEPGTPTYDTCRAHLINAYKETECVSNANTLCQNTEWIKRENVQVYTLQDLLSTLSPAAAQPARQFAQQSQTSLLEHMQQIATSMDFVAVPIPEQQEDTEWWSTSVAVTPMDAVTFLQQATAGFNMTRWLELDMCRSVFDDQDICKTQNDDTSSMDACLFPDINDRQDLDRYLLTDPTCPFYNATTHKTEAKVVITYLTNSINGQERHKDEIYLCDTAHTEQCIVQFFSNPKELQTSGNNDEILCEIEQVDAPAGVEVQAFVITGQDYHTWKNMIEQEYTRGNGAPAKWCSTLGSDWGAQPLSPVKNCVWKQTNPGETPEMKTAWASASGKTVDDAWLQLRLDTLDEQWHAQPQWATEGCPSSKHSGFCAIKIRLQTESGSKTVCSDNRIPPTCAALMHSDKISTFRVCNDDTLGRKTLYRCDECTKYNPVIKASGGRFGCYASTDHGRTMQEQMNVESITKTLGFLADETDMRSMLQLTASTQIVGGQLMTHLQSDINPTTTHSLRFWGNKDSSCAEPMTCWDGFDSAAAADANSMIWNHAVSNPSQLFTMICSEQPFTVENRNKCNPKIDERRRKLRDFVQQQYREKNGVWMPRIAKGKGLAWETSVARSDVSMFSVMYAQAKRDPSAQVLAWVLGEEICGVEPTVIQDRICVESLRDNTFEAMHPWVGGDFNPFEGLDECTQNEPRSLCACACSPQRVCNYYDARNISLAKEFPSVSPCERQAYPQVRSMREHDDNANLCGVITNAVPSSTTCTHPQGLLGGALHGGDDGISTYHLHEPRGVQTTASEFLVQSLLSASRGLWGGKTLLQEAEHIAQKYAFLRMPRADLHPAHIALGRDHTVTGAPLVIQALALLRYDTGTQGGFQASASAEWVHTLPNQWQEDRAWIATLYPPRGDGSSDWSCPVRAFSFWGGEDPVFAPITPDPLLTKTLYDDVAHPFIKAKSLRHALAKYETTNGACFYEKSTDKILIPLTNGEHPCGLQGIIRNLLVGAPVVSKIVNRFDRRCNLDLNAPNVNNTQLRSGETLFTRASGGECGVLHRLTPFLMRTRGDAGTIVQLGTSSTRSEGGDCHMGRAMQYEWSQRADLVGRQCALSFKNRTHGISLCPRAGRATTGDDRTTMILRRSKPQSLDEMLLSVRRRTDKRLLYRNQVGADIPVTFIGPRGVEVPTEVSFGLLYSASIARTLASDLLHVCARTQGCTAHIPPHEAGSSFFQKYVTRGGLVHSPGESTHSGSAENDPSQQHATQRNALYAQAEALDAKLWNHDAWTWTFRNVQTATSTRGNVNKTKWLRNRYDACNESYHKYGRVSKNEALVEAITLCEPAPTGALQTFCQAMAQFRTDITSVNCQLMGKGKDCLYKPGMFYLPYAWSVTNQEFIADTVLSYYTKIVEQPRFAGSSITTLCPARNDILGRIRELSLQQQDACPGYQIEYLKNVLKTFKAAGHDLLYLGFCTVMAGANLIGTVFATEPAAVATMAKMALDYVVKAIQTAANVIMPILNTLIDVLFGTSSAGRVFKNIMITLCEIFKFVINNIVIGIWCAVMRPMFGGVLRGLQKLIRVFDSSSADKMDEFLSMVFGSDSNDIESCLGALGVKIPCNMDKEQVDDDLFPNQPMATSCWVDTSAGYYTGGAGILAGSMTNSFLACSVSDTCAVDPLRFDNYENPNDLVPCASCPAVLLGEGQKFGCNTYLKRCTCGIRTQTPMACMQNSDCSQQPTAVCSVSSNLDYARDSVTSLPCAHCSVLGAESVCLVDGAASTGVCTCADVRQSLHTCTAQENNVLVFKSTGYCLTMTTTDQADAVSLSFSELGIARCSLGMGNKCMYVNVPLMSSSSSSQAIKLAVLTGYVGGLFKPQMLLFSAVSSSRRLLAEKNEDPHRRWCEQSQEFGGDGRERVRWCTHWKMIANQTLVALGQNNNSIQDTFLLSTAHLLQAIAKNPRLFAVQLLQDRPDLVRHILMQHSGIWPSLINSVWQHAEWALTKEAPPNTTTHREKKNARTLLFWEQESIVVTEKYKDADVITTRLPSCAALEVPLNKIIHAFWDTIAYYERVDSIADTTCVFTQAASNNTTTASSDNTSSSSCGFYRLPPEMDRAEKKADVGLMGAIADLFLTIPTGGMGGRRVLDAAMSTMGYDEAVRDNYITGRRLVTELSFCNYTRLTFGTPVVQQLLPLFMLVTFVFFIFVLFFSPNTFVTWALWVFVYPSLIYWLAYQLSPLCWPMIPPRLPHDLAKEIKAVIPDSIDIPLFLIRTEECDARGRSLVDGSNTGRCFKSCTQSPFYFQSWQDSIAWWLCEIDTGTCRDIAHQITSRWSILQDMTSSLLYYGDVVDFAKEDGDFMRAHRVCAIFTLYQLIFAILAAAFVILVAPAAFMAVCQVFAAALELIMEASGAENIME